MPRRLTIAIWILLVVVCDAPIAAAPAVGADEGMQDSVNLLLATLDFPTVLKVASPRGLLVRRWNRRVGWTGWTAIGRDLGIQARDSVVVLGRGGATGDAARVEIVARDGALQLECARRRLTLRSTVRIGAESGRLRVVARLPIEDYLVGVLAAESDADDPTEYLVALAALQRNYLRAHPGRHRDADLCDNTHCQLFDAAVGGSSASPRMHSSVKRGGMLRFEESILPSYYSACCGGGTLTPADVWKRVEPGYSRVACNLCNASRWYRWTSRVPTGAASRALLSRAPAPPFVDEDFKIRAGRLLGWRMVPGNTIDALEQRGSIWLLRGRGFGHRVGLCQAGARQLALRSRSAVEILRFYFPVIHVTLR